VYLHVGGSASLHGPKLVLVLDPTLAVDSEINREWLGALRARGRVHRAADDPVRALVVTDEEVWLAPVTPATLAARARRACSSAARWRPVDAP